MRRTVVFLLLGPTLAAFTAWSIYVAEMRGFPDRFAAIVGTLLFLFTLPVSAFAGPIDGCLARALPLALRAPLTAIAGATVAVGLLHALIWMILPHCEMLPQSVVMPFAAAAALCMGACSVLSTEYRR